MNTQYTDNQLKQALAKMLPEKVRATPNGMTLWWNPNCKECATLQDSRPALNTELLHLCWLVEETFNDAQRADMVHYLCTLQTPKRHLWRSSFEILHASWQQKVQALAQVKGVYLSKEIAVKRFVPL